MYLIPHLLALMAVFILPLLPLTRFNCLTSVEKLDKNSSTSQSKSTEAAGQLNNNQPESNKLPEVRNGQAKKIN